MENIASDEIKLVHVVTYCTEWDFEGRRGCTVHYLTRSVDEENAKGSQTVKATADHRLFLQLDHVPGVYEMTFSSGGRASKPTMNLQGMECLGPVEIAGEGVGISVVRA